MKVTILKSNQFIAFFEGFTGVPMIANSLNELKKQVVNEVYRISNFLEKKLPKDADSVEITSTISVKESVKDLDENLFYVGFNKKAYSEFKSLFIQTAFSFKCMVDSLVNVDEYFKNACSLMCGVENCESGGGIIETAFTIASELDKLSKTNELLAYKRIVKLCYVLTNYALSVYNEEKLNNVQDIFFFD